MAIDLENIELSSEDEAKYAEFVSGFQNDDAKDDEGARLVKCKIIKINDDFVMVDVGYKTEKRMDSNEIRDENGELLFKEGDEIEVLLSNNGRVSYKQALRQKKAKKVIEEIKDKINDLVIEVEILRKNKGGFRVLWKEKDIECFLPRHASALKPDANLNKPIKVCITKLSDDGEIIVSRKKYFDISKQNREGKMKEILESSGALSGEVVSVTDFGIFVNIGGVEGLVHSSEMTHKNFANPASLYKVGDKVNVKVLGYNNEKRKLSLSIKALTKDPWESITNELQVGYTIKAVVISLQPYGAFVDAGNDIEGFLHITEIAWEKNIKRPDDYLQVGQEIDVEIIELDPSKRRLRVSLKKLTPKPFLQFVKKHKEGDILNGEVATLTDFGAFIRFGNIDGLLHNEDLSWEKKQKCKDVLKVGMPLEVMILKIDKQNEKISLSRKALIDSPIAIFDKAHKIGDAVKGKIVESKDFGVFVNLGDGVDALIKNEDLSPLNKSDLKVGDEIEASIAHIDTQHNKIRLSVKKLARKKEQDELKSYNNDEKMTLGDILKDRMK